MQKFIRSLPLIFFMVLFFMLAWQLKDSGTLFEKHTIPRQAPQLSLDTLDQKTLSNAELQGHFSIVHVWATWCEVCQTEHPIWLALTRKYTRPLNIPVYGVAYEDDPSSVKKWLKNYGNPYTAVALDLKGEMSIEWGVKGTPTTFLINPNGRILYEHLGAMTEEDFQKNVLPFIAK